jgi:hypothetical protein
MKEFILTQQAVTALFKAVSEGLKKSAAIAEKLRACLPPVKGEKATVAEASAIEDAYKQLLQSEAYDKASNDAKGCVRTAMTRYRAMLGYTKGKGGVISLVKDKPKNKGAQLPKGATNDKKDSPKLTPKVAVQFLLDNWPSIGKTFGLDNDKVKLALEKGLASLDAHEKALRSLAK